MEFGPIIVGPNDIIFVAGLIGAVGVILGALWKPVTLLRRIAKDVDEEKDLAKYTRMCTLKLVIVNEVFSDEERLEAYERYKEAGGNGYMEEYARVFKSRLDDRITRRHFD